jgi:hypothetical protein
MHFFSDSARPSFQTFMGKCWLRAESILVEENDLMQVRVRLVLWLEEIIPVEALLLLLLLARLRVLVDTDTDSTKQVVRKLAAVIVLVQRNQEMSESGRFRRRIGRVGPKNRARVGILIIAILMVDWCIMMHPDVECRVLDDDALRIFLKRD